MKNGKLKLIGFALVMAMVLNTQSVFAQKGSVEKDSVRSSSVKGGGDTGGGDVRPFQAHALSASEIEEAIKEAIKYLKPQLQSQEMSFLALMKMKAQVGSQVQSQFLDMLERVYSKFFLNKDSTVYDLLTRLTYNIQEAPCLDEGFENDASYANGVICFSLSRLTLKLKKENLYQQLFGIIHHELAHAFGEVHPVPRKEIDDLDLLRDHVASRLEENSLYQFKSFLITLRYISETLTGDLSRTKESAVNNDLVSTCVAIGQLNRTIQNFYNRIFSFAIENGFSILSRQQLGDLLFTRTEVSIAGLSYCNDIESSIALGVIPNDPNVRPMYLATIGQRFIPGPAWSLPAVQHYGEQYSTRTVVRVGFKDAKSLFSALESVEKTISRAIDSIK